MKTLSIWIQATRPKTLIASISPIAIGSAMSMADGFFSLSIFCFLILTGLGVQITTNYANDWLDFVKGADRAGRKGPARVTQQGLVTVQEIKRMTFVSCIFTLLCSIPLIVEGGLIFALLVAVALLLAIGYTGGPYPIAYLGLGDLFVLVFFGPVATCCSYYLMAHRLTWPVFFAGLAPGLLSCALLTMNNLRDIEEDRKSRKKTLIVRLGKRFGTWQTVACLLIPPVLPLAFCHRHLFSLLTLLCLVPALSVVVELFKVNHPQEYAPLFGKVSKLLGLYTFIFCTSWMI